MTVKQLYKKYKDYSIMLFGIPLEKPSTPFSHLPTDIKKLEKYIVKEMKIEDKKITTMNFDITLNYKGQTNYRGSIYAYVVKEEEVD